MVNSALMRRRMHLAFTLAVALAVAMLACRAVLGIHDIPVDDDAAPVDDASPLDGASGDGGLGDGACEATPTDLDSGLLEGVTALALGDRFSCALTEDGRVLCWGTNDTGQLGVASGKLASSARPRVVIDGGATLLTAGDDFACAVVGNAVECWGANDQLQLGRSTPTPEGTPQPIVLASGNPGWIALGAGFAHACALTTSHLCECWGANQYDQAGSPSNGATDAAVSPQQKPVVPNGEVGLIAAGTSHSCFADEAGVYCWGSNTAGQLGVPDAASPTPTPPGAAKVFSATIHAIAANSAATCVLTGEHVECAGTNTSKELGSGSGAPVFQPIGLYIDGGSPTVLSFAIGDRHSCFVSTDGQVYCVGDQSTGELGDKQVADASTPFAHTVLVPGDGGFLEGAVRVAVGGLRSTPNGQTVGKAQFHTCAIVVASPCDTSGRVYCWGANGDGQLGLGSTSAPHPLPSAVVAP